ncbi:MULTISPECIES: hypothetical protein [unclassified Mesorhizobium]|uniref:hypothetical protein n=1 Tax=unclassified Mesorhizobium TaxID=325217 RepID=UPI00112865D9|nr:MULTISPECIES: hypothetical protein [unclassified Mesorhizobium]MBZ9693566.1 hypothetical protein [Mesorhizobium sp. CO1-1-9]TPK17409.1 hypothetical protein FJ543_02545 [Mesorhizobium sp. B2-5-7]
MARPATPAVRLLTSAREPVRLATTGPIDVDAGGLLVIDSVQTSVGDRILVKDQADGSENGIRTASEGQWYGAADARTARTMQKGTTVTVQDGTANAGKTFAFQTLEPVIGDSAIVITEILLGAPPSVIRDYIDVPVYVADRSAAKALDGAKDKVFVIYNEGGRNGQFSYRLASSLSASEQAMTVADTSEGVYFTSGAYTATRQGGWHADGNVAGEWFGILGTYLVDAHDDASALQAALNMASTLGARGVNLGIGTYGIGSQIVIPGISVSTAPAFRSAPAGTRPTPYGSTARGQTSPLPTIPLRKPRLTQPSS